MKSGAPVDVEELARARSEARSQRDWGSADALRAQIEAAGWKVIDTGIDYRLEPAAPPDVVEAERVRYGSSGSVPSRISEAPVGLATVVILATDWPDDLARAMAGLRAHAPAGTTVVIVADHPSREQADILEGDTSGSDATLAPVADAVPEVVWTSARLGHASALNAGIRRAPGPVIVLLDTSAEPTGDVVAPLAAALEDSTVGVCGSSGVVSADLRHFDPSPVGEVDAVLGYCMAFRRADYDARGPLDERFGFYRNLDLWWSLVLRDEGHGRPPRRAVALDIPLEQHEHREWLGLEEGERTRLSKRNFYRILDRFGRRRDLLTRP